ncbi:MAG: hypothetical protein GEV06_14625 [Luteitalea sp.]|nr:hypothetical protein [Luteitalea sp.]
MSCRIGGRVMKLYSSVVMVCLATAGTAFAQAGGDQKQPAADALRQSWDNVKAMVAGSAELMPEDKYAFKPTPDVRSFGGIIGHVANSNYMFCSAARGDENPNKEDFEKTTEKAALVEAVKASIAYCDEAFTKATDASVGEQIKLFGRDAARINALLMTVAHGSQHYGNLVTYLRMNELVPPSSAGSQ